MRLTIKDNRLLIENSERDNFFWHEASYFELTHFFGEGQDSYIKVNVSGDYSVKKDCKSDSLFLAYRAVAHDSYGLKKCIELCRKYGVEVDSCVYDVKEHMSSEENRIYSLYQKRLEEEKTVDIWERKKKYGCKGCKELVATYEDEWKCAVSGEAVEVKNSPDFYNGVHYLFNYLPYPNEKCKYKKEIVKNG